MSEKPNFGVFNDFWNGYPNHNLAPNIKSCKILKKENILSYIVFLFSVINIYGHRNQLTSLSVALSVIGIIGVISFALKNDLHKTLFLIWIVGQFPILQVFEVKNGIKYWKNIFDLSQAFKIKFGFGLTYIPKTYSIGVNIIPFIFYALYKSLIQKSFVSKTITIIPITEQSIIAQFSPLTAVIRSTENGFFRAEFNQNIEIEENEYHEVLFKTIDKSTFKLDKPRQKCLIKLISLCNGAELKTEGFVK